MEHQAGDSGHLYPEFRHKHLVPEGKGVSRAEPTLHSRGSWGGACREAADSSPGDSKEGKGELCIGISQA